MEKIKVTIEIPVERLTALQDFLTVTKSKVKKEEPVPGTLAKKEESVPVPETPAVVAEEPKVTKSDLRAVGVKLTKADREADLKAVFEKYGAKNLGTLDEACYADVLKELEALV